MPSHLLAVNPNLNPQTIQPSTTCTSCANSTMSQSASDSAPELKTYNGNCHCGAFKFSFRAPEITSVTECNCSICFKKGYRWIFPGPKEIVIGKGEGTLKEYRCNTKKLAHQFCPICGTSVLGQYEGHPPGINVSIQTVLLIGLGGRC
jgi:hypothetical protein